MHILSFLLALLIINISTTALAIAEPVESSHAITSCVVFTAPDFSWQQPNGKTEHLVSLRGKPVLLLIAPSPHSAAFHHQLRELKGVYERLAAQGLICIAAFTKEDGRIPSNIPFVTASCGMDVARAYDVQQGFAVAVIGRDGNLDCLSTRVLPGQRIYDLVDASYTTQEALRRQ
ncbi:MAG: hypothetical protein A3F67_11295 [Verrucomicrobia bacterium RIFCSPHIGHO2_12_FULL_41_10]|nr:MAG: hypothetical protein A3F67_11295 [Verrucomicrobia bacterium RIFCSPHIGHO2_12_FULL_41_10]HLB33174.1 hypothetical protein [Chthoniobacterales bacterium]